MQNTKIVVVGKGSRRQVLEGLLGDRAIFTGELRGGELADAYAAFDVFVFTSITDTFGQVLQEAKAAGLAVVAPNVGGPRNIVDHEKTGFLYEAQDDEQLRSYVEMLITDRTLRDRMGREARASVENRSWGVFSGQIVEYYWQAIERHARRPR